MLNEAWPSALGVKTVEIDYPGNRMGASAPSLQRLERSSVAFGVGIEIINFAFARSVAEETCVDAIEFKFAIQGGAIIQKSTLLPQRLQQFRTKSGEALEAETFRLFNVYRSR